MMEERAICVGVLCNAVVHYFMLCVWLTSIHSKDRNLGGSSYERSRFHITSVNINLSDECLSLIINRDEHADRVFLKFGLQYKYRGMYCEYIHTPQPSKFYGVRYSRVHIRFYG
jgi:hypothetical protein